MTTSDPDTTMIVVRLRMPDPDEELYRADFHELYKNVLR